MITTESYRLRFMRWVASLVDRLAWPIVIICFLTAAISVSITWKNLGFKNNPNDLLSSEASYHKAFLEYTHEFGAEEDYAIVVKGPEFGRNRECVEFIAQKLGE